MFNETMLSELKQEIDETLTLKKLHALSQSDSFMLTIDIGSSSGNQQAGKASLCLNQNGADEVKRAVIDTIRKTLETLSKNAQLEIKSRMQECACASESEATNGKTGKVTE